MCVWVCVSLSELEHTGHSGVQTDVAKGPEVEGGEVPLRKRNNVECVTAVVCEPSAYNPFYTLDCIFKKSVLILTSSHSVEPMLPKSPPLQLANTMLLLGLNPSAGSNNTNKHPLYSRLAPPTHFTAD